MKRLYEKSEMTFAVVWIVVYCVLQSLAITWDVKIGIPYSASAVLCLIQAGILLVFMGKNRLMKRYGLCKPSVPARQFLYYAPLAVLATGNLWNGIAVNYSLSGTACRIVCMLCVGFVEEVIFRGFLFQAMAKENVRSAIMVSSVTFGIGHLVNLFNGSGMGLVSNLCQICFAVAVGFLFVTVFYRGGSLLPCVITHSAINILSTFANEAGITVKGHVIYALILIVLTVSYTCILIKTLPDNRHTSISKET